MEAVDQSVGLVGHTHHRHQLGQHVICHAFFTRGRGMTVNAICAAVGDTDRSIPKIPYNYFTAGVF
jgi:hypothetical protein